MRNKWFDSVFLPSIFSRAGVDNRIWLTAKQTNICTSNMEKHTASGEGFQGERRSHSWYSYEWEGRKIYLDYSKLNGCSTIEFGMNESEIAEHRKQIEFEKAERDKRREERICTNPKSRAREIERLEKELKRIETYISDFDAWTDIDDEDIADHEEDLKRREQIIPRLEYLKSL